VREVVREVRATSNVRGVKVKAKLMAVTHEKERD
jgi:hypothetical protein